MGERSRVSLACSAVGGLGWARLLRGLLRFAQFALGFDVFLNWHDDFLGGTVVGETTRAGAEGLEPTTCGFGIRCSTN